VNRYGIVYMAMLSTLFGAAWPLPLLMQSAGRDTFFIGYTILLALFFGGVALSTLGEGGGDDGKRYGLLVLFFGVDGLMAGIFSLTAACVLLGEQPRGVLSCADPWTAYRAMLSGLGLYIFVVTLLFGVRWVKSGG